MRFPEQSAGGFTRLDGTVSFYGRVQALLADLPPEATVLDFGAGRGQAAEDPVAYRRELSDLRGECRTVVGVDVEPAVLRNERLDDARVIGPDGQLPLDDQSVNLVVSDFTFEHVKDPVRTAAELDRVLKPGGWICARTPNRWGYIAIGARLVPNRWHAHALRTLQPQKATEDTFPTRYRLNTRSALERHFPAPRFEVSAYTMDAEGYLYAGSSKLLSSAISAARYLPGPLRSMWFAFIRKASNPE